MTRNLHYYPSLLAPTEQVAPLQAANHKNALPEQREMDLSR